MMKIKKARQILKSFADDTRLCILNLLKNKKEVNVTDICRVLDKNQSNVSKHLTRLRLTGVVGDKREGNNVHYFLAKPTTKAHRELLNAIFYGLPEFDIFKEDIKKFNNIFGKEKQKKTSSAKRK
ncbi:MAG: metalloregulator ArsR/SmtB family transcription factor [Candidatus Omnitrophica bacterium]|nr:metalloregulator ArsR/SmtB family transcription factor [Candidatus Omnitrophota bacterium]